MLGALRFIDFLLDPANAQQNFEYVGYQPAVVSAVGDDLIDGRAGARPTS